MSLFYDRDEIPPALNPRCRAEVRPLSPTQSKTLESYLKNYLDQVCSHYDASLLDLKAIGPVQ